MTMWEAHLDDGREHEVQQPKWQRMLLQHLQVAGRDELSPADASAHGQPGLQAVYGPNGCLYV